MHRQFSFKQACEYLRIPEQTLRDAVKYGEVPCRKQGDEVIFDKNELQLWGSHRILRLRQKDLAPEHAAATRLEKKVPLEDLILPQLLKPQYINLDLRAKTRKSVLRDLVEMADGLELLCDPTDMIAQLEERETVSSTALPGGIALPHPHHPDPYLIMEPFMIIARTQKPIWFGAEDDAPTDIFCLVCCGENLRHLHVLARLCMMIRDTEILETIRAAQNEDELIQACYEAERQVLARMR